MKKMANYLDFLLEKWMNPKKKICFNSNNDEKGEENQKEEETIMIDYGEDLEKDQEPRNFIKENKKSYNFINKINNLFCFL